MSDTLHFTAHDELQLFALLAALGLMLVAASAQRLPPSILLVCGGRLDEGSHDHPDDDIDPRLEALKGFELAED